MTSQVHSIFHKLLDSPRLSRLVGKSMPDRIRSIGFAFLSLTAAAGLALVAIFAQMGFPLLAPAPLPSAPEPNAVGTGVPLVRGSAVGLAQAQGAAVVAPGISRRQGDSSGPSRSQDSSSVDGSGVRVSGADPSDAPGTSDPVVVPSPAPAPAPAPAPSPAPTTPTEPAPVEVPVVSPDSGVDPDKAKSVSSTPGKPGAKPAAAKPPKGETKPAKSKPAKPTKAKPAKSEPKPAKPEAAPTPEAKYIPAPSPSPAPAEGKDKLQEETGAKGK